MTYILDHLYSSSTDCVTTRPRFAVDFICKTSCISIKPAAKKTGKGEGGRERERDRERGREKEIEREKETEKQTDRERKETVWEREMDTQREM